jgi:hypothetical protein
MMYLGKPVVATGWSGNMDFMDAHNSMPVRYTLKPLAQTIGAYEAGPEWAEADVGHAAHCIRRLFDEADLRQRIGAQAARDMRRVLDPKTIGEKAAARLGAIVQSRANKWPPILRRN